MVICMTEHQSQDCDLWETSDYRPCTVVVVNIAYSTPTLHKISFYLKSIAYRMVFSLYTFAKICEQCHTSLCLSAVFDWVPIVHQKCWNTVTALAKWVFVVLLGRPCPTIFLTQWTGSYSSLCLWVIWAIRCICVISVRQTQIRNFSRHHANW